MHPEPPKRLALQCGECLEPAVGYVRGTMVLIDTPEWYHLVQCEQCQGANLVRQNVAGSAFLSPPTTLFPTKRARLSHRIPKPLREELEEARRCLDSRLYTATAVMVRRTLEGFCQDQGSTSRTLNENLRDLANRGVIDPRLLEWAHGLRALGNAGAHFTGTHIPYQDAQDAVDLAEALLGHVYVFTVKFEDFKRRRLMTETT